MEDIILFEETGSIEHYTDFDDSEIEEYTQDLLQDEDLPADQEDQTVDNRLIEDQEQNENINEASPDSLSGEAVTDLQKEIEDIKNELHEKSVTDVSVPAGNDIVLYDRNVSINTISGNSVSQNIIDTPLNEYSLSDSLTVVLIVIFFTFGMITIIKRSLFKWT